MPRNPNCTLCRNGTLPNRSVCLWGTGTTERVDVLVVKESPDATENRYGYVKDPIEFQGLRTATTLLVKCMPPTKRYKPNPATKRELTACQSYFIEEWTTCRPRILVLLGAPVTKFFFPTGKWEEMRGEIHQHPLYGPCLVTYHPGITRQSELLQNLFKQDLSLVYKFLQTGQVSVGSSYGEQVQIDPSEDDLRDFFSQALNAPWLASDVETVRKGIPSGDYFEPDFEVSHYGFALPTGAGVTFDPRKHPGWAEKFLCLPQVVHSASYEGSIYPKTTQIIGDTYALGHLRYPGLPNNLEAQARLWLGPVKWKGGEISWEDWARRNAIDIHVTAELYHSHLQALDPPRLRLHDEVILPASLIFGLMYGRGVPTSSENQRKLWAEMEVRKAELHRELRAHGFPAGGNPNSTQQIAHFLYTTLGIEVPEKALSETSDTPGTGKDILAELALEYPICRTIMAYRKAQKFQSNYVYEGFPELMRFPILPCGTITGRPAVKGGGQTWARDKRVRMNYIAQEGMILVSGDLSQAELRIAAGELAHCPVMMDVYRRGLDIHNETCRDVIGADPSIKEMRSRAKPVNFLLLYGGLTAMFRQAALTEYGILFTEQEAENLRARWLAKYFGIPRWHQATLRHILLHKEIRSPLGYVWAMGKAGSRVPGEAKHTHNCALNYPDQSTCAMATNIGLIAAHELCPTFPILTIHDQVYGQINPQDREEFQHEWKKLWERRLAEYHDWNVPLLVDLSYGPSMGELVEVA